MLALLLTRLRALFARDDLAQRNALSQGGRASPETVQNLLDAKR